MNKHTPGPWKHVATDGGWDGVGSAQDGMVCKLVYNNPANACLIAAAPDLLEALIRAERKLSAYVGVCKGDKEMTVTILPMARAAIKRAEGHK